EEPTPGAWSLEPGASSTRSLLLDLRLEQVSNLAEELLLRARLRGRCLLGLLLEAVVHAHDEEDDPRDDEELDEGLERGPVADRDLLHRLLAVGTERRLLEDDLQVHE